MVPKAVNPALAEGTKWKKDGSTGKSEVTLEEKGFIGWIDKCRYLLSLLPQESTNLPFFYT